MRLALALVLSGCASSYSTRPGCTEADLGALTLAYAAAIDEACPGYDEPRECPAFAGVRERYAARFEEWSRCR